MRLGTAVQRNPADTLLKRSNFDHRKRIEVDEVIQNTKDVDEKYGSTKAW